MTKFSILGLLTMLAATAVQAQTATVPDWLYKTPQLQGAVRKSAGKGDTPEAAINDAAVKIMQSFQLIPEEGSLIAMMTQHGHRAELSELLAPYAVKSHGFRVVDTCMMAEGETFVWCEYKQKDAQTLLESLFQAARDSAIIYLMQGRAAELNGDFKEAVSNYTAGLNLVIPVSYRKIVAPAMVEEISLSLCTEYAALYDSIQLESFVDKFPMEQGQPIPYDFKLRVKKGQRPLKGIPIRIRITQTGQVTQEDETDANGILKYCVQRAPQNDNSRILAMIDFDGFLQMTHKIIRPMVENKFKMLSQQKAQVNLYTFDKTPVFLLDMNPSDSAVVAEMLTDCVAECNYKLTTDTLSADLILSLDLEDSISDPIQAKEEEHSFVVYQVNTSYAIYDRRTFGLVSELQRKEKLLQPANKGKERMRARAVEIVTRKSSAEIKKTLQNIKFDKAKYVYEETARNYNENSK
jgi:hypothetical protein